MEKVVFPKKIPAFPKNGKNSGFPANLASRAIFTGFPQERPKTYPFGVSERESNLQLYSTINTLILIA
jgi:hypothetical protein